MAQGGVQLNAEMMEESAAHRAPRARKQAATAKASAKSAARGSAARGGGGVKPPLPSPAARGRKGAKESRRPVAAAPTPPPSTAPKEALTAPAKDRPAAPSADDGMRLPPRDAKQRILNMDAGGSMRLEDPAKMKGKRLRGPPVGGDFGRACARKRTVARLWDFRSRAWMYRAIWRFARSDLHARAGQTGGLDEHRGECEAWFWR